jgi:glucosyl-dolichyl phosphate glucuronosyltransferase
MMTVLFATRDRAESLGRVLLALLDVSCPKGGWKLVVADNGSRDETGAVLDAYANRLNLTVVREASAGKNRALNRAIPELEGDLIALTDDDVIPDRDWLVRLRQAADAEPRASIFGGSVIPLWPSERPAFICERAVNFSILYARNVQPEGWCKPAVIFGPNMAVRARVFQDGFTFAENVGPDNSRQTYVMGSETDFVERLAASGHRGWFVPEARVQHIIRPDQLTEAWILRRYYMYGMLFRRSGLAGREGHASLHRLAVKQIACVAAASLTRHLPAGWLSPWLRLRILSRERFFAGVFAESAGSEPVRRAELSAGTPGQ